MNPFINSTAYAITRIDEPLKPLIYKDGKTMRRERRAELRKNL